MGAGEIKLDSWTQNWGRGEGGGYASPALATAQLKSNTKSLLHTMQKTEVTIIWTLSLQLRGC